MKNKTGQKDQRITQELSQPDCTQTKKRPNKLFFLPFIFCLLNTLPAMAEGSKELVSQGGNRPYLENINFYTATFKRQTIIKASVEEGDWINMGSSVIGTGSGDILYTPPGGSAISCKTTQPGKGEIENIDHEANGPGTGTGGSTGVGPGSTTLGTTTDKYQPCLVQVGAGQGGIWTIEFIPPKQSKPWSKPAGISVNAQWPNPANDHFLIAAWDVTVRTDNNNTVEKTGRVFTELLALNMSGQGNSLNSDFWILTTDGYQYKTSLDQLDPNGFVFLANNKGLLDTDDSPLYHSSTGAADAAISTPLEHGIEIQEPVHKIFFNPPANDLGTLTTPILTTPTAPTVSNLSFAGNLVDNASNVGAGGTFKFNSSINGSYQIAIRDSSNAIVRVLQDPAVSGANSVVWDGKDSSGTDLPPGAYTFNITVRAGEYHFPLIDVENNPSGITFELLNPPGPFSAGTDKNTAFYDDTDYTTAAGTAVTLPTGGTPPNPRATDPVVGTGTGSSSYHKFGSNDGSAAGYGNEKVIDTWIYFNSPSEQSSLTIVDPSVSLDATKQVTLQTDANSNGLPDPGDVLRYTIALTNSGTGDATGVTFNDTPDANTTLTVGSVTTSTGTVTTGNNTDDTTIEVNIGTIAGSGGTATVTFDVTINALSAGTSTNITNQGNVTSSNFSPITTDDPDTTDTADDPTTITVNTPNVTASKTSSLVVDADSNGFASPGDTLEYTITVENSGSADATGVALNDPIPTNTTYLAGSLSIDRTDKTDATTDDEAEFDGTNTVFRLGSGATSTAGGTLAVDASSTVKFQVTINDGTANGTTISNQGTVTGSNFSDTNTDDPDQDGTSDPNTVTINTDAPNVTASKTSSLVVDADSNGFASPGDTLEYTITVENSGSADATGVALNDPIPTNTTYLAGSLSIDRTDKTDATTDDEAEFDGTNTVFRLGSGATSTAGGTLAVDASSTVKFQVTINDGTANGTTISNQGTVTGSNFSDTTTDDPDQDGTSDPNTVTINTTLPPEPSLIIIKRITAVKRGDVTETLAGFNNDPNDLNDDIFNSFDSLLSGYVQGEFQVTDDVRPGDEVEYTIYFLSNGTTEARKVQICDFVPANQTFVEDGFNSLPQAPNGFSGTSRGMAIAFGNSSPLSYTNANDGDNSRFISPTSVIPQACLSLNTSNNGNGAVLFNLGDLPNFSSDANASFGFVRFRAQVE